jgi:hypothetical protein
MTLQSLQALFTFLENYQNTIEAIFPDDCFTFDIIDEELTQYIYVHGYKAEYKLVKAYHPMSESFEYLATESMYMAPLNVNEFIEALHKELEMTEDFFTYVMNNA